MLIDFLMLSQIEVHNNKKNEMIIKKKLKTSCILHQERFKLKKLNFIRT